MLPNMSSDPLRMNSPSPLLPNMSSVGKFGSSAAVGQVLPPAPQQIEKQGWTYVSRPNQMVRKAHREGEEISGLTFSRVSVASYEMRGRWEECSLVCPASCCTLYQLVNSDAS